MPLTQACQQLWGHKVSQIEFIAQAGYVFTVALYNPLSGYSSLATGLTVTEVVSSVYRCSTGSVTGLVYVVATSGALRVVGFVNLDAPGANGYSEVLDTLEQARAATELLKVPRADQVLSAGGAAQRTLDGTFTDFIEEKIRKVP